MNFFIICEFFIKIFGLFLIANSCFSQELYKISGYVLDSESGTTLIGANLVDSNSGRGAISNIDGYYSLYVDEGTTFVVCSFIGYSMDTLFISVKNDIEYNFELKINSLNIGEVTVNEERLNIESLRTSTISVSKEEIREIPQLLGEMDIIKAIQLLPGIQSGNEGASGFYVRGGGPDQNLILFDGAPIYNSSHLLGFFSTFNESAVNSIQIIKGGFPAEYGGRLSSILNITGRNGNMKKWKVNGGIGVYIRLFVCRGTIKKRHYFSNPFFKKNLD